MSLRVGIRIQGTGSGPADILSAADFTYLGMIRMPASGVDTSFAQGGITGRVVSGDTHLFITGNPVTSDPNPPDMYELNVQGLTPTTNLATAPQATLYKNWGDIYHGKRQTWAPILRTSYTRTASGTPTLIALRGDGDRTLNLSVTITQTFADGDGTQPTVSFGQTGSASKFASTSDFHNATIGTVLTFSGTLTNATAAIATQVAATGTTSTGAYDVQIGTRASLAGLAGINHEYYWHDGLQMLFWSYDFNYTDEALWTIAASTLDDVGTGASTGYGPWPFTALDKDGVALNGSRAILLSMHPTSGKMLSGGILKSGAAGVSSGPSVFGGNDWPTTTTVSGIGAALTSQPDRYLNYYNMGANINYDGTYTPPLTSMAYDGVMTYPYEYFAASLTDHRISPQLNGGIGSWADTDASNSILWLEGATKRGVLAFGTLNATANNDDPNDPDAAHEYYNNQGQISAFLTGITGTFVSDEYVVGSAHGATGKVTTYDAAGAGLCWAQENPGFAFTVGETVTGFVSGAVGTVDTFDRLNVVTVSLGLTGVTGTFVSGETITGSIARANFKVSTWTALGGTLVLTFPSVFQAGETVTGLTSGAVATISVFQRHDQCTHGFTLPVEVTGPGTTAASPVMMIFNPTDLQAVADNIAQDYAQAPVSIVDLASVYGVITAPLTNSGGARSIAGTHWDAINKRLYLVAIHADDTTGTLQSLLHVFSVNL